MKGLSQRTTLCAALVGGASAFVGAPLTRPSPAFGLRAPGAPTMSVVGPSPDNKQQQAAEVFEVDFDGVREAFDGSGSSSSSSSIAAIDDRGAGGGALNLRSVAGAGAAALTPLVLGAAEASAKGGEFGIIEGKSASFFHPIVMGTMFAVSLRSAKLGLEWREQRTMGGRMRLERLQHHTSLRTVDQSTGQCHRCCRRHCALRLLVVVVRLKAGPFCWSFVGHDVQQQDRGCQTRWKSALWSTGGIPPPCR
ncbi:unnamed protein product [Ectocarpus sp. 13 AM-2016]